MVLSRQRNRPHLDAVHGYDGEEPLHVIVTEVQATREILVAEGTARAYNVAAEVTYTREFVPLLNDAALVDQAFAAARTVFAPEHVSTAQEPMTGSEDFARFLEHVPGCFVFVGNGKDCAPLHNPAYDFNDQGLLYGARFHAAIVRQRLPFA